MELIPVAFRRELAQLQFQRLEITLQKRLRRNLFTQLGHAQYLTPLAGFTQRNFSTTATLKPLTLYRGNTTLPALAIPETSQKYLRLEAGSAGPGQIIRKDTVFSFTDELVFPADNFQSGFIQFKKTGKLCNQHNFPGATVSELINQNFQTKLATIVCAIVPSALKTTPASDHWCSVVPINL